MDLLHYFEPVDFELFQTEKKFTKQNLGYYIEKLTLQTAPGQTGKAQVALAGIPDDRKTPNKGRSLAPAEIRKYLYRLSNFDADLKIIDLGNLKPGKGENDLYFALRDVVDYLREAGVVTIFLGGGQDLSVGIARAFQGKDDFTLSVIDTRVDTKTSREVSDATNFISRILRENPQLFHLQFIVIQSHVVPPSVLNYLKEQTFDALHLGQLRDQFAAVEPALRNTDFLSFDLAAIKQSDAAGHFDPSPNGLYSEEACRLARYAGLSNRLSVFGLFEVNPVFDKSGLTANLAAQIVWYFLEAVIHRRTEDPKTDKAPFSMYYVEMEEMGEPMVFYYHPATNRWWLEIHCGEGISWTVACHENDYKQACQQEIPDTWWKYARKTDRLSK